MNNITRAASLITALPETEWRRHSANSQRRGPHLRRQAGAGTGFWQFRSYVIGDDGRDVDWKQSGKRDALYVRQRQRQTMDSFALYRDASASMDFSSAPQLLSKKDYAETLFLALSMFLLDHGENLNWTGIAKPATSGRGGFERLIPFLPQMPRDMPDMPPQGRGTGVIFSDFYKDPASVQHMLSLWSAAEYAGLAVQVFDPAEASWPHQGRWRMTDPENPSQAAQIIENATELQNEMQKRFLAHQKSIADICTSHGWHFIAIPTSTPPLKALLLVLQRLGNV
jgi:uncharacterized protein (DUF58 family)